MSIADTYKETTSSIYQKMFSPVQKMFSPISVLNTIC